MIKRNIRTEIDHAQVIVSNHAVDRAIERLHLKREDARRIIRGNLRNAEYISEVADVDGKYGRMFAHDGVAYVLDSRYDQVLTLYRFERKHITLADRFAKMARAELRKWQRKESVIERDITIKKAKLDVEAAECRYKMAITPSKAVLRVNNERLRQIDEEKAKLDEELAEVVRMKTAVAKGLTAFI